MDKDEIRERFRDQMPGMAIFDELLNRHAELIEAQKTLRDKWNTASPAKVQALRTIIQEILDAPAGVTPAVKQRIRDALREAGVI